MKKYLIGLVLIVSFLISGCGNESDEKSKSDEISDYLSNEVTLRLSLYETDINGNPDSWERIRYYLWDGSCTTFSYGDERYPNFGSYDCDWKIEENKLKIYTVEGTLISIYEFIDWYNEDTHSIKVINNDDLWIMQND